jgi:hypothetical protein
LELPFIESTSKSSSGLSLLYISLMLLPFDYIGYKRLSENTRFPNQFGTATPPEGKMGEDSPLQT